MKRSINRPYWALSHSFCFGFVNLASSNDQQGIESEEFVHGRTS